MKNRIVSIVLAIILVVFVVLEVAGVFGGFQKLIYAFDDEAQEAREQMLIEEAYNDGYADGYSDGLYVAEHGGAA